MIEAGCSSISRGLSSRQTMRSWWRCTPFSWSSRVERSSPTNFGTVLGAVVPVCGVISCLCAPPMSRRWTMPPDHASGPDLKEHSLGVQARIEWGQQRDVYIRNLVAAGVGPVPGNVEARVIRTSIPVTLFVPTVIGVALLVSLTSLEFLVLPRNRCRSSTRRHR